MTRIKLHLLTLFLCSPIALFSPINITNAEELEQNRSFTFSDPVAYYDNKEISKSELDTFLIAIYGYSFDEVADEEKAKDIISGYIRLNNITNYMKEKNLHQNEKFLERLRAIEYQVAYQLAIEEIIEAHQDKIEEEAKKRYQNYLDNHDKLEYETHYILADNREAMNKIIQDFQTQKKDFSKVLNNALANSEIKYQGGLLANGWLTPSNMNVIFAEVIPNLKKGEITEEPLELNDTFYVLYLNDVRDSYTNTYEEMEDALIGQAKEQVLADYLDKHFSNNDFTINK